ncbi:DUF4166 domain-containing protein [Cohnella nanjingensis]|uniref:DUF4166 domain-containing protein n=1 Tax=Cohnella nanjingensis TaxID=1387779 RepID=A0A7X0RLP1_9BACL|nr:DUF4166 domain-containing protein [Cohnella nanjingensis]MBB6669807.1 DUF4166 domain-containing protein [Cohnella nanjingensis]
MPSIYELALGDDFARLHPKIRERFGFSSADGIASFGAGVMDRIWHAKWAVLPLALGATRNIMFPQSGRSVPFKIANYAYRDELGRETVTWNRAFQFADARRRFEATMIYSGERGRIVDYLGNRQHLAVDLDLAVAPNGGIRIRSGEQRFYEGPLGFRFPSVCTGIAEVCEWYDDDAACYRITVAVRHPIAGPVFAYEGAFQAAFKTMSASAIPIGAKPLRLERRE